MTCIENRTFDEIAVGESVSLSRTLSWRDIELFAAMSGDVNPAHMDVEFAKSDMFHKIIAHGMWGGALISTVLGTELPGPGTIYVGQTLRFRRPIGLGDTVTVRVTATAKEPAKRRVTFGYNTLGIPVAMGVLYPFLGILLSPLIAAAAMAFSSVTVVTNANRLRFFQPRRPVS